ncbi:MAG: lipopolysaccharide kinase InaA family protein [Pseudomonadales bacterium]
MSHRGLPFETVIDVVLKDRAGQPKVARLRDGRILKLFRNSRRPSLRWFYPTSFRFRHAAGRLRGLGIPVPDVEHVFFHLPSWQHGVIYRPLAGSTLEEHGIGASLLTPLATLVAGLHHAGIYFRGLHPGNIVLCGDGSLGLIDFGSARFFRRPLNARYRERNLNLMVRMPAHRALFSEHDWRDFLQRYRTIARRLDPAIDAPLDIPL